MNLGMKLCVRTVLDPHLIIEIKVSKRHRYDCKYHEAKTARRTRRTRNRSAAGRAPQNGLRRAVPQYNGTIKRRNDAILNGGHLEKHHNVRAAEAEHDAAAAGTHLREAKVGIELERAIPLECVQYDPIHGLQQRMDPQMNEWCARSASMSAAQVPEPTQ